MLKICYEDIKYNNIEILSANTVTFDKGVTLLVGENGSGKTTLFNALFRELNESNIRIYLDNEELSNIKLSDYRNNYVTFVSQQNRLFEELLTMEALNILGVHYTEEAFDDIIELLSLSKVIKRNPKIKKLSGGEKQKVKLLYGLLSKSPILLLDEPFNNLDSYTIKKLNEYLKRENRYLIITSHIDLEGSHTQYQIKDKKINSISSENYDEKVIITEEKKLGVKSLKSLRKSNKKLRYPLYIINILIVVFFLTSVITTINIFNIATIDRSNYIYGDTATTIKSPIASSYFLTFGNEQWLEKVPTYFSDEDIENLENLEYVEKVIPIKSDGYGSGGIDYKNKYILDVDVDNENTEYTFSSPLYSREVAINLPSQVYPTNIGQIEKFESGTYPNDDSNEVMLDTVAADYVLANTNYSKYNELVGENIDVPVMTRDNSKKEVLNFKISGVFSPIKGLDDGIISGTIVTGFDVNNRHVQSTYTQYESRDELYTRIKQMLELTNIDSEFIVPEDIPSPAYDSLYIEVAETADVKLLTEEISNYDQYIEIENNYLYSQSINFKYLNKVILKNIMWLVVLLGIFIVLLKLLFKLYKNRLSEITANLRFYAYNTEEVNNFIKFETKEYIITVSILNLIISVGVIFAQMASYNLTILFSTNILLIALNYLILKITLKEKHKI